jgi:DNA repair and recombination protein RAD52
MGPPQHQLDTNQPQRPSGQANQQPRPTSLTPEQALPNNQRQQQQQTGQPVSAVPVGFITARAADKVEGPTVPSANIPPFNPHAESPSIRKTNGISHNRSAPISRQIIGAPVPPVNGQNGTIPTPNRSNFINPQADTNRRIGMPGGAQSPLTNRAAYKPPGPAGVKRGPDGGTRPALADVSNMPPADGAGDLADAKRQKLLGN